MNMLSLKIIRGYDYIKAKRFVEDELYGVKILGTKLTCLLPPTAGRQISLLDKVDTSMTNGSKQEKYVEKKDLIEKRLKEEINKHQDVLDLMTEEEMIIFEEEYINQITGFEIEEKYKWSTLKVNHIKKSFIIKFALARGQDIKK